ncbi:hypothetical protein UFOVP1082_3 [uncultured Caudovirales phage]|uniref:Uncharacterized protein n=1 Tax=uncultured Caudovirales phage TaxID=2100421 RepID=A0A6J5RK11_9CAUD|nr:hypothetical protein UFOVP906_40 [uncultured Caudovirales phage]CAB4176154.1 hypothetical protein UFOVP992_7 [uncultured Caudovirales phage]CAB4182842.1 hypothetical protein UFOVP1082_3 [uncultured Caudovirales phage]CAB4197880.1 hypothetical protein UFOVP1322_47 [uncultured Caudovirales phage]CAB4212314.1 hypothetical protein UFOVP1434_10 [uncultured Caudovirales phage]
MTHAKGKLTPTVLKSICEAYAVGMTVNAACDNAGVSSVAFHRYRRLHPEFDANEWAEAESLNTMELERKAHELAITSDHRNCTMLIFMLKARKPSVYRDNVSVQHSGTVEFAASFAAAMEVITNGVGSSVKTH